MISPKRQHVGVTRHHDGYGQEYSDQGLSGDRSGRKQQPVAVGIYLPFELSVAIFIGGLIAWAVKRNQTNAAEAAPPDQQAKLKEATDTGDRYGLLFAAGAITGEALVGILLAIPIVVAGDANVLAFWGDHTDVNYPGIILLALVIFAMYRVAAAPTREITDT